MSCSMVFVYSVSYRIVVEPVVFYSGCCSLQRTDDFYPEFTVQMGILYQLLVEGRSQDQALVY